MLALTRAGAEEAFWHWRLGRLIPHTDSARLERYADAVFAASGRSPLPVAREAFLRGYVGVCWWIARSVES
jgi:hypothetical protein